MLCLRRMVVDAPLLLPMAVLIWCSSLLLENGVTKMAEVEPAWCL